MITLIISSVSLLLYEVENKAPEWTVFFEDFVVTVFIFEYLLRSWLYSDIHSIIIKQHEKAQYLNTPLHLNKVIKLIISNKSGYFFSASAIIDLLAILPSYRPLRILRVFLVFRLFKLFRYSQSVQIFTGVLINKRLELTTLAIFMGFLIIIASAAIYTLEYPKAGGQIDDLYDAFYWAIVTISTVGYGDITPTTSGGRVVASTLIISGLGILAFFTSIIVAAFNEKMSEFQDCKIRANIDKLTDSIILCGYGRVGQEIAEQLHNNQQNFIIIETNEKLVEIAKKKNYIILHDDASKNASLEQAGIHRGAKAVLCVTDDDIINVYITLSARQLNPTIPIISRANREDNVKKLYQAGANHTVQPFSIAGLLATKYINHPIAFEAIHGILHDHTDVKMDALKVHENCFLDGTTLIDANLDQYKTRLIGVSTNNPIHTEHKNSYKLRNQHFYFNPAPNFTLQANDVLIVIGRNLSIDHLQDIIETSRI